MTQTDKLEQFKSNLHAAVLNSHKYGMSWVKLRNALAEEMQQIQERIDAGVR